MSTRVSDVVCRRELDKSIVVWVDDLKEERVIPKSVILEDSEVQGRGDEGDLVIETWFARKEGLT